MKAQKITHRPPYDGITYLVPVVGGRWIRWRWFLTGESIPVEAEAKR